MECIHGQMESDMKGILLREHNKEEEQWCFRMVVVNREYGRRGKEQDGWTQIMNSSRVR